MEETGMIFSKIARILAIVAIALGLVDIMLAISVATMEPYETARARYLGNSTPGEKIDRGIYTILFAVALGTLAEINLSIRKAIEQ